MLVKPLQSAVIANGMISLSIGRDVELADDVAERLIVAGIVESISAQKTGGPEKTEDTERTPKSRRGKKVPGAPENKAVGQDAGNGS